eukprot:TRINITY_DN6586_c0_g6_i1.p1 TRINITY_DN6586_c0_g6~~TRINITY_DN6586_c0_g6_i1.p1  ORF type:complete len:649 (-),score=165.77 TRINITY_DN6586_c0_g6_i1:164-2110(-)
MASYQLIEPEDMGERSVEISGEDTANNFLNFDPHTQLPPLTLSFHNVSYTVPYKVDKQVIQKTIIKHITGMAPAGKLLAVLGPSGAGKTTFLDILAQRKSRGTISGEIMVNGQPVNRTNFRRYSGYVLQDDLLMGCLTVYETLKFAASLKLPGSTPNSKVEEIVESIMAELGLDDIRDSKIGTEFVRGISGGEKKRVCIGCELVTFPSLLFLDEPTSGLDSFSAFNLLTTLRNLANRGRTIIFTIHQPSSEIYRLFDNILLVTETGQLGYYGPADQAINYFSSVVGLKCDIFTNPCDFLLSAVSARSTQGTSQLEQVHHAIRCYESSDLARDTLAHLGRFKESTREVRLTEVPIKAFATSFFHQFAVLLKRSWLNFIRNPLESYVMFGINAVFGLMVGSIYFKIDRSQRGVQDRLGGLFFILMNGGFSCLGTLEIFIMERSIFIRERANGMYRPIAYFLSKIAVDLPQKTLPTLAFCVISYWMMGLNSSVERFVYFLVINTLTTWISYAFCLAVSSFSSTFSLANIIAPAILVLMMLPSGFLQNAQNIPKYWYWLKYISLFKFGFEALTINEFKGQNFFCNEFELVPQNCTAMNVPCSCPVIEGGQELDILSFDADFFVWNLLILGGMVAFYLVVAFFFIQFTHKEKR